MSAIASALCGQLSGTDVFIAMSLKARDMVIAASSGDSGEMASEDFFLYRNLLDGQGWRGDVALNLRFSDQRTAEGDSDSIWWGGPETRGDGDLSPQFWIQWVAMGDSGSILWDGREWTDDAGRSLVFWDQCVGMGDSDSILWGGREWTDDQSLSDARSAAHFDFRDCLDGDFDPSLGVDRLAADLKSIPDSDIPRDLGLPVGGSALGRVFGGRGDSRRRGDIYFPDGAFQNIYLREVAA
jgi:hypothetical protein